MSQIINPERRDPGHYKNKADVGLSKVDNLSAKELQDLVHGALREEYATGEIYAKKELSEGKEVNIPLLKFIGKSSRATILLGFLSNEKSIESYARLTVKHSFDPTTSFINGEQGLEVEIEGSPRRTFYNSRINLYYSNSANPSSSSSADLYLHIPKSSGGLKGITINITEEIIVGEGDSREGTIQVVNHTNLTSPSKNPDVSILLSESDREISSFSRSLAIYDSNGNIYYPDTTNLNKVDLKGSYNFPTINGVPFTGERNVTNNGKSLRDITIRAKHSGSNLENAGPHDWEVLKNVRVVGYNGNTYSSKIMTNNQSTETVGLCRLCDIPVDYNPSASIYELLDGMNSMVEGDDEHVVSRGFLKKYNALLRRLIGLVVDGGGLSGGSTDNGVVGNIQFYHNDQLLTYLGISPTKNIPAEFVLQGKISYNTEFTLAARHVAPFTDQDAKFKITVIGENSSDLEYFDFETEDWETLSEGITHEITENSRLRFFSEKEKPEVGDKKFKIQVTNTVSSATISQLNAKAVGGLSIYRYTTEDNSVKQEIGYITIKPRYSPNENNSIFYRRFNSDNIKLPFVFAEVGVKEAEPKYTKDYFDCQTKGEKSRSTSSGLIWENISSSVSSNSSLVNYSYQPGIILPPKKNSTITIYCYSMIHENLELVIPDSLNSKISGNIERVGVSRNSEILEEFNYENITSSSDYSNYNDYLWKIVLETEKDNENNKFEDFNSQIQVKLGDSVLAEINLSQRAKPYSFSLDKGTNPIRFYGSIKFDKVTSYIPINDFEYKNFSEDLFEIWVKSENSPVFLSFSKDLLSAVLFKGDVFDVTNSLYLKKDGDEKSGGYKVKRYNNNLFLKLEGKYSNLKEHGFESFHGLKLYISVKEDLFYLGEGKNYPKEYLDYPIEITLGDKTSLFHKTFEPKLSNLRFGPFHGIKNNDEPKDDFNTWLTEESRIIFDQTNTATEYFNNAGYYIRQYSQTSSAVVVNPDMDYMLVGLYNRGTKTNPDFVKGEQGNWSYGEDKNTKKDTGLLQVVLHDETVIINTDGTSKCLGEDVNSFAISGQLFNYDEGRDYPMNVYTLPSMKGTSENVWHGEKITTMPDNTSRDDYKWKNKTTIDAPGFVLSFNEERSGAIFRVNFDKIIQDPEYLESSENWKNVWRLGIFVNSSDSNVSEPYYYLPEGDSMEVWNLLDLKLRLTSPDGYK